MPAILMMMIMHCVSVAFGAGFTMLFDRIYILIFSSFLFVAFGLKLIYDAYYITPETSENKELLAQVEAFKQGKAGEDAKLLVDVHQTEDEKINEALIANSKEAQPKLTKKEDDPKAIVLQLILGLFIADWGDRCQISAIVLTATRNLWGVAFGGAIGMGVCCALASFAGVMLAGRISEKTMLIIGAILFFLFAAESGREAYKDHEANNA